MILRTSVNTELNSEILCNYFGTLVNQFFKILPMRENNEESLPVYIESLQVELLGCNGLVEALEFDPSFLSLVNILQFLIDNPECSVKVTKREVFKAISICNKLKGQFQNGGVAE